MWSLRYTLAIVAAPLLVSCSSPTAPTSSSATRLPPAVSSPAPNDPAPTPPTTDPPAPVPSPPPPAPAPAPGSFSGELTITSVEGAAIEPLYHVGDRSSFALVADGTPRVDWSVCDARVTWKAPDKWVGECFHHPPMPGTWEIEVRGREVTLIGYHPLGSRAIITGEVR